MEKEIVNATREAVINGDLELFMKLIESNNGLIDHVTVFGTWLHVASTHGQLEIVKYLISKGIDIDIIGDIAKCGAIKSAASEGHLDIVQYLHKKGASFDVTEPSKNPLFGSIYGNHFEVAKYLIDNGIDITVRYKTNSLDNEGAYEYARTYGKEEIAEYLKEKLKDTDYFSANRKDHNPLVNR